MESPMNEAQELSRMIAKEKEAKVETGNQGSNTVMPVGSRIAGIL
jgi:hypothetical protein